MKCAAILAVVLLLEGCASERIERKGAPIANAKVAVSATSVFLMEPKDGSSGVRCSGVLVTPHLLLTAAHCFSGEVVGVDCAKDRLDAAGDFTRFRFTNIADTTTAPPASSSYSYAQSVTSPAGELLCGNDFAIVELSEAVPANVAVPSEARRDSVREKTSVRAIGYGAGHPAGTGEGVRRSSSFSEVLCVGAACGGKIVEGAAGSGTLSIPEAAAFEFATAVGACPGDSGGPLFDEDGFVRGLLSRGDENCGPSIATPISAELASRVRELAMQVGDEVPEWTNDETTPNAPEEGGSGGEGSGGKSEGGAKEVSRAPSGGCAFGSESSRGSFLPLAALSSFAILRRRKRLFSRRFAPKGLVLCASLLALGCSRKFSDTEGRHFAEKCEGDACEIHEEGAASPSAFRLRSDESVLSICPKESKAIHECRALVCASSRDCSAQGENFVCSGDGLCRHESRKRTKKDKIVECQSGLGPWTGNSAQRERLTLARACDEGCELPAVCRGKKK